jgi:hypothetical protein
MVIDIKLTGKIPTSRKGSEKWGTRQGFAGVLLEAYEGRFVLKV